MSSKLLVQFGPDQTELLDRLAGRTGESKASILRRGLTLLAIAANESKKGNAIGVVSGDRVISRLVGVWDEVTA